MATPAALPARRVVLADVLTHSRINDLVLVLGAALLTAAFAQLRLPVPGTPVPITGQTLAVVLAGAALGPGRGMSSQLLYVLLGAIGLPFYSDASGGLHVLAGPTGGYLIGFIPAAFLMGLAARRGYDRWLRRALPLFIAGQLVIFLFGVPWLAMVADLSPARAIEAGFLPFVVGGLVKAVLAGALMPSAWRLVAKVDTRR